MNKCDHIHTLSTTRSPLVPRSVACTYPRAGRMLPWTRRKAGAGGKLEDESYLIIAVSPWRMVMLSVARCISTLRTGNPVGIRHSSLKKEACNCLQHVLRPTCILKHRSVLFGSYRSKGKRGGREKSSCPDFSENGNAFKSKAVRRVWMRRFSLRLLGAVLCGVLAL